MAKPKVKFFKLYPGLIDVALNDELIAELNGPSGHDKRGWDCEAFGNVLTHEAEEALNDCWGLTIGEVKKDVLKTLKRLDYDVFKDYDEENTTYFKMKHKRK